MHLADRLQHKTYAFFIENDKRYRHCTLHYITLELFRVAYTTTAKPLYTVYETAEQAGESWEGKEREKGPMILVAFDRRGHPLPTPYPPQGAWILGTFGTSMRSPQTETCLRLICEVNRSATLTDTSWNASTSPRISSWLSPTFK